MAVITWRSLSPTADAATGANLLAAAQRSGNLAFDPFKKILADQEAFAASQAAGVREGNKQAFLTALQGAKTPEEVATLQASGQLQELQSKLTPQDLAAVRGADEARVAGLRQQITAGQQFDDGQVLRGQRNLEDDIASDIAAGRFHAARATILESPQLANKAKFVSALAQAEKQARKDAVDAERAAVKFEREGTKFDREGEAHVVDLTYKSALADQAEQNTENARVAREQAARAAEAAIANAQADAQTRFLKESGNVYSDGVFNPNDTQGLIELMTKNGIGNDADARAAIIKRLAGLGQEIELPYVNDKNELDKKKVSIPLSLVKQAILGANGGLFFNSDNDFADSAEENLRAAMKKVVDAQLGDGRSYKQNKAVADFATYMNSRIKAAENPVPVTPKRTR